MPPAPRPENCDVGSKTPAKGSDILITGVSGRFPKSNNVKEFKENLYGKVDMLSDFSERWDCNHPELPPKMGMISDLASFDAQFFAVHYKQAECLDPMVKKLLECTCEAVIDAGVNPRSLRGRKIGVFVGGSIAETEIDLMYNTKKIDGYGLTGTSKTMYSNRISYWLGLRGPSYSVDGNDNSGAMVVEQAYQAISDGHCEAAIVGACNLSLFPHVSLNFSRLNTLSKSGELRSFDESADGYARADSVVIMFLQRTEDAKRGYAEVVHAKTTFTQLNIEAERFKYSCGEPMMKFLKEFYNEVDVDPKDVSYLEAFGLGDAETDRKELEGAAEIFCSNKRKKPLMIGSVKSNMGHSETASGLCAIVKVLMGYHTGQLAPNLHIKNPRQDVAAVREGRLQFLTEPTAFDKGYAAINSFSITGMNGHVLLKNYEPKKVSELPYVASIPELVCVSGRTVEAMQATFLDLETKPLDHQQLALLRSAHESDMPGFLERGYSILTNKGDQTVCLSKKQDYCDSARRPVWFIYSGMGSQWTGMGTHLMRIPTFAKAIYKCQKALEPYDVDLIHILTSKDDKIYDSIINSFLGIAAVQIGLTDVMKEIGINFDNIIGHSLGEMGCAYADGCLTAEQTILGAYGRGLVSNQTKLIKGAMAAVGIGYTTIKSMLPNDIEVACHNGPTSCTISGPAESMAKFVGDLTAQGVFAKIVPTSNIAYHSRYITPAGDGLRKFLKDVIKDPKPRSFRWISTSVPAKKWSEPYAQYCSAEYLTINLLSPVLFEEASSQIPTNALTIEIAPHGLLQAIIKRSLSSDCVHISLASRGHNDNVVFLLESIGKDYQKFEKKPTISTGVRNIVLTTTDDNYNFLKGYVINGVNYLAPAAQLVMVWETLGMTLGIPYRKLPVEFVNVRFDADVQIGDDPVQLLIMLQKASGVFEIVNNGEAVSSGQIFYKKQAVKVDKETENKKFSDRDVYRIFTQRGFNFRGDFRSIVCVNSKFNEARIFWDNNFVTFIDGIIQLAIVNENGVTKPKYIQNLTINLNEFQHLGPNNSCELLAVYNPESKTTRASGIEMTELKAIAQPRSKVDCTTVQQYEFLPFINKCVNTSYDALRTIVQTVINNTSDDMNVVELRSEVSNLESVENTVHSIVKSLPTKRVTHVDFVSENFSQDWSILFDAELVVVSELSKKEKVQKELLRSISTETYVVSKEFDDKDLIFLKSMQLISTLRTTEGWLLLLKRVKIETATPTTVLKVPEIGESKWIETVEKLLTSDQKILIVSSVENADQLDQMKSLWESQKRNNVQFFIILDPKAPAFDPNLPLYKDQIKKELAYNYYKEGAWGDYYFVTKKINSTLIENYQLHIAAPGDIKSLVWLQSESLQKMNPNSISVEVHYARVSFSDLIIAQDRTLPGDFVHEKNFGVSFSGITSSGKRVMGLVKSGAAANRIEADIDLLWPVPDYWTLEEAATVPQAYVQAFYCLTKRAALTHGMSVIIMSGAGALGQAAINICLAYDCEIFTTVSDAKKKRLLLKLFPKIKDTNIINTRKDVPVDVVLSMTKGRGCDIVINTAQGIERHEMMKCAGPSSKFVDISFEDMEEDGNFGMSFLWMEKAYVSAIFSSIFNLENEKKVLQKLVFNGIKDGWVKPLSHITLNAQEASRAFKLISTRRNHGAVLLRLRSESPTKTIIHSIPTWRCTEGVFVVVCDNNNVGLEVVEKLINLGAKNIFINTRDPKMGYLLYKIKAWLEQGIRITVSSDIFWNELTSSIFLTTASKLGQIKGLFIVNSSIRVRHDNNTDSFNEKIVEFLDLVSRKECPYLEHFVVITSLPTRNGNLFADIAAEAVCEKRLAAGFHALALKCLSYGANAKENNSDIEMVESMSASLIEALNALPLLLTNGGRPVVAVYPVAQTAQNAIFTEVISAIGLQEDFEHFQHVRLWELNVNLTTAKAISLSLKQNYGILVAPARLLKMTLSELKDLKFSNSSKYRASGLFMFFNTYDQDELQASEPLVWLPTLVGDADGTVDQYGGGDYLIVVPGWDGHRERLLAFCQRLKLRALFCQHSTNRAQTVRELAKHFTEMITRRIGLGKRFYILGDSFGSILALEMAMLLESDGLEGKVFCLDGSPTATKAILESQFNNDSIESLQNSFLLHMCGLMANGASLEGLGERLEEETNWDAKVVQCLKALRGKVSNSVEYQKIIIECGWTRIVQAKTYKPIGLKLKSEIILLRSKTSLNLPSDYELNLLAYRPIKTFELHTSHASISYDPAVTNIVNNELDDEVRAKFDHTNQCVKNRDKF